MIIYTHTHWLQKPDLLPKPPKTAPPPQPKKPDLQPLQLEPTPDEWRIQIRKHYQWHKTQRALQGGKT